MGAIVIDIETYGRPEDLPPATRERMKRRAAELGEPDPDTQCALSPYTGRVIVVGLHNAEERRTTVLYESCEPSPRERLIAIPTERDILETLWRVLRPDHVPIVTFNGRVFDLPFLMVRSAILGLAVPRHLVGYRYEFAATVDLVEVLTFFGTTRRPSLDLACHAFGIPTPKADFDGAGVAAAYEAGRIVEIAEYCGRDVEATAELYRRTQLLLPWKGWREL